MSAQHAAEMLIHHTTAAAYHQGKAAGRQESMRLVRQLKQRMESGDGPFTKAGMLESLVHLEELLFDLTKESEGDASRSSAFIRDADALLSNDRR